MDLRTHIVDVPDFPRAGILFKDITPLLAHAQAYAAAIEAMATAVAAESPQYVAGIEARGFLFAGAIAHRLGLGCVPLRKPGKLPGEKLGVSYELEYGSDRIELRAGTLPAGARVAVVDDVLATGGTLAAALRLIELAQAQVSGVHVLIELEALGGRARLPAALPLRAVMRF